MKQTAFDRMLDLRILFWRAFMTSSGFAVLLIIGIAFFATGVGGLIAHALMAVGGIGLVASIFGPSGRSRQPLGLRSKRFDD
jgi:hypothetical protein